MINQEGDSSDEDEDSKVSITEYMKYNLIYLRRGGFGNVYGLKNNLDIVIKKVVFEDNQKEMALYEVETLRQLCGQSSGDYLYISRCYSELIPSFFGCFIDGNVIYQFHRRMAFDITTVEAITAYRALYPYERVMVMLDMIDIIIELHELEIVHGDIKPSNFMLNKKDFSDTRVIDFGLAREAGERFIAGTEGYKPPEVYSWNESPILLDYNVDVFALGMTFAEMEGHFDPAHSIIKGGCLLEESRKDTCEKTINQGLDNPFIKTENWNLFYL